MKNEDKNEILKIEQNSFKTFFKEFIEETKQSTEKKNTNNLIIITIYKRRNRTKNNKG
jgi:hypothetical protein